MEFTFSQLKQKDVISITDGKNLGKVCDVTFSYPENHLIGLTVTGCKGFRFTKQDLFIPIKNVVKIGEDTVLVKMEEKCPQPKPPKCPPENCPPKRPPNNCPPNVCPPNNFPPPYPPPFPPDRRSYDEYE